MSQTTELNCVSISVFFVSQHGDAFLSRTPQTCNCKDGGEAPPDEMDPDVKLPIYHTPAIPFTNPMQPFAVSANKAADGSGTVSILRRRRRLLIDVKTNTQVLPVASALLRGRTSQDPTPLVTIHDFWEFNMQSDSWLRIPPNEGTKNPPRRSLHTAIAIGQQMFIFGKSVGMSLLCCIT